MSATNKLIMAFVTLLIGVILLSVMAQQSLVVTDSTAFGYATGPTIVRWGPDNNVNDTFRWYMNNTGAVATSIVENVEVGCGGIDTSNTYMFNGTTAAPGTNLGLSGAGNWTLTCSTTFGQTYITYVNSTGMVDNIGNTTAFYVKYYPMSYLTQGWNRTILNLTPGFFALALLAVSLALFYSIARDYGMV
jgi:hypothetical protein